jgi:hypothetical protein
LYMLYLYTFILYKGTKGMAPKKKKAEIKKKKPWSTSVVGWKGKMFKGVWANKQWLPISLVWWVFEYFLHGIINGIYTRRALFSTVFIPNLTTLQPHLERRIYKIIISNW